MPTPAPIIARAVHRERRIALAAGLAVLWAIFALLAQLSGALETFEAPLIDWRLSLHAYPSPPSDQLALVAIDTIPSEKPWPWSRFDYSLVLRSLIDYAPQSVVFEMNLNDRDTEYTSFDDTFAHIVQRANGVIFAATVKLEQADSTPPAHVASIPFTGSARQVPRFSSAVWPLETFAGEAPVGINNLNSETGLRLRRLPLVFRLNDQMVPSLVLQATAQFLGADLRASEVQVGRAILLRRKDGKILRTVPIDDQGRMPIRFHTGPVSSWRATFDNILVYDEQRQLGIRPEVDVRNLIRRQVWIGRTDPGDHERFHTPVGQLSRTEVEMQAERTILEQDYIRPLPPMILAVLYLLVAIAGAVAVIRLGGGHAAAVLLVTLLFWTESSVLVFRIYNVVLPIVSFVLLTMGSLAVGFLSTIWDFETEEDEVRPG